MIALRPIHGRFGPMIWNVKEGRTILPQILKLLNVKKLLKDGVIKEEKKSTQTVNREVSDN